MDGIGDVLQVHSSPIAVLESGKSTGEPSGRLAHDHLTASSPTAEAGGDVERRTAERPIGQLHRLA